MDIQTDDFVHPLVMSALVEAEAAECDDMESMLAVLMDAVMARAKAQHITVLATFRANTLIFERITMH